ncbi:YvrJ family protein [Oceanirhabdus seepicola]|uniref:YvrJ family protein n=1 Tax=Oceanirhabdus seepicola TaxID=2828781 RepID=A0A9J6NYD5_9CLOT|nr:YvrJ family protein [Oceanirhabdus seepicola]MCM1989535.1 YvrJ family protein [Oceanirhabdus seepicola]
MYEELSKIIGTLGFPIAMCIYLLVRFDKKIEILNQSILNLTRVITSVIGTREDR